jgi:glyoxylase-like metal-dependent hydrolase (beta-lactamase superfamily II)
MEFKENEVREVGPGVWVRVAVDNIAWCDLGEWAVVIDALEEPDQADVVRDLIRETTGKELKYVVNTHWDLDHIACNPQWKREGATVIAHKSCAEAADRDAGRPDIWFDERAALRGQDDKAIEMLWQGGTHTPWDTVLYFPHAQVLHIADLFAWGLIPCKPTPAKATRLREVYDRLVKYDAQVRARRPRAARDD